MGFLQGLLKEVPLSGTLNARVLLAEENYKRAMEEMEGYKKKIASLELENNTLRAQVVKSNSTLDEDATRVLVHLFKTATQVNRDVTIMCRQLDMDQGVLKYHLDRLKLGGLAHVSGGTYVHGRTYWYWALTPGGRQYVLERKLL